MRHRRQTKRFGRNPNRNGEDPFRSLHDRFDIGGYLDHQGEKFHARTSASHKLGKVQTHAVPL